MVKDAVFMLRLDSDMREDVEEKASEMGITSSEYIRNAVEFYLENYTGEIPSQEEIEDMDWDELEELIEELELDIAPEEYDHSGFFGSPSEEDTEELREAVMEEFGYSYEEDDYA